MKAIVVTQPGGPEVLALREVPDPTPQRGEVRVRIRATAVNRADLLQRMGMYPAPPGSPPDILGLEIAGEVEALGDDVRELAVGDRVFGVVGGGGYAEHLVAHARTLAKMPAGLSFTDAAAIPEAFMTAWDALVDQAGLGPGETVLVHAAGSGVGTAGVQIARALGARCIGTARTADKLERARSLGLDEGVVVQGGRFADAVSALTGGAGVDVVLELVGGAYVAEDVQCAAERGRIVLVGLLAGTQAPELNLAAMLRKRVSIVGTVLRARPLEEKIAATNAFARHVVPLVARGVLRPVIEAVLPLERASEAHERMAKSDLFGKLVLEVPA
jgi:putative PIG3 family NAD(P)H quinone oxidoreductase